MGFAASLAETRGRLAVAPFAARSVQASSVRSPRGHGRPRQSRASLRGRGPCASRRTRASHANRSGGAQRERGSPAWKASGSSGGRGLEGHGHRAGRPLAVLEPVGQDTEIKRLGMGERFFRCGTVCEAARKIRHVSDPPAVLFALDLDAETHAGTVPPTPPSLKFLTAPGGILRSLAEIERL